MKMKTGKILDIKYRRYIYSLGVGIAGVLFFYNIVTKEEIEVWTGLFALMLGLARVNTEAPETKENKK